MSESNLCQQFVRLLCSDESGNNHIVMRSSTPTSLIDKWNLSNVEETDLLVALLEESFKVAEAV